MSILSAIKQQSGSIEDLAKLPQTMIMQMAQRKEIVPEMVPAILAKKAEMIDRIAKNKAAQGGIPQQSVMDQIMASNAQAENPQTMGQMPPPMPQQNQMRQPQPQQMQQPQQPQGPADVGIASNPIPPMQMAGGGIIAFAEGDQVKALKPKLPATPANAEKDEFKQFLQEQFKSNMADTTDPFAESKIMSQQYADELKNRSGQDMNMALLSTAAGMMAGESPYFFTNVGKGAQEGTKSLAASNAQKQADKRLLLQQKVEAEKAADARKAQRSLGVERNLTDLYNREEQAATARLGYEAQLEAAKIGRIPPPSDFDKNLATIEKLEKLDPKGELGLVAKYKKERKDYFSDKTVSDDNAITKTYGDATKTVMNTLSVDPKWIKLNRDNPPEARRIAKEMIIEQAQSAIDFAKNRGASSGGGGSGAYKDLSNEKLLELLQK